MKSWRICTGLAVLGLTLAACGGDDENDPKGTKIDCSWFAGDNCYKKALASANSCLPSGDDMGTFSATNDKCTYTSGHTVTFNKPPSFSFDDESLWDFSVASSAGQCVSYSETDDGGFTLKTPDGTFTEEIKGIALQFTCPDGSQFYVESAFDTLSCDFSQLPGYAASGGSNTLAFSFIGSATQGGVDAFYCAKP